jgi:hypothetical protein
MDWKLIESIAWGVGGVVVLYFRHHIAAYSAKTALPKFNRMYGENKGRYTKMNRALLYWPTAIGVLGILNAFLTYFGPMSRFF